MWFLIGLCLILWTALVFIVGVAVGTQMARDKNDPKYQDGKPIQNFNYHIPISDEEAADKSRLDVLWDWYKTETYVKGKPDA